MFSFLSRTSTTSSSSSSPTAAGMSPEETVSPYRERPSHHANDSGTLFKNPWPSASAPTWTELATQGVPLGWAKTERLFKHPRARDVRVLKPDWGTQRREEKEKEKKNVLSGTWLGHASCFVELPFHGSGGGTVKMLFDPIFSYRAGPTAYTGPARMRLAPCSIQDLPGCDCLFISHNHYDHLDLNSVTELKKAYPDVLCFVPLGNKSWFVSSGFKESQIVEMDWWDDVNLSRDDGKVFVGEPDSDTRMRVTCVPAQHNSGRGARDQMTTLWCGWVIENFVDMPNGKGDSPSSGRVTRRGSVYFAGDTGYRKYAHSKEVCPAFDEIGKKYGPFDLSFIPIWRGGTLGFVSWAGLRLDHERFPAFSHGTPGDAVCIHEAVKSRNSVAMHFGTFVGSESESVEAIVELAEACESAGVAELGESEEGDNGRMGVVDIGESLVVEIEDLAIF